MQVEEPIVLEEHKEFEGVRYDKKFDGMKLIEWSKSMEHGTWGYHASYFIGAEWTQDRTQAVVVTPKKRMQKIDFVSMFYYCFSTGLDVKEFSKIYTIEANQPPIEVQGMNFPIGLLTIVHFLSVVSRIRCLKKEYKKKTENLKKVRGHVDILKNDRINISTHNYHNVYCRYNEYDADIPENRVIKKALLFAQKYLKQIHITGEKAAMVNSLYVKCKTMFTDVSDDVELNQIKETRYHKLYKEYGEALRLAKMILQQYDYNIRNVAIEKCRVIPFTINMPLLYEHYVYGLMHEAYKEKVLYQYKSEAGKPDFLFRSDQYKAIVDTKYIPRLKGEKIDSYIIQQMGGYGRDKDILGELGVKNVDKASPVPCVIIYPTEGKSITNPFKDNFKRNNLEKVDNLVEFYKMAIPLPTL